MGIKFTFEGTQFEAETAADAAELFKALKASRVPAQPHDSAKRAAPRKAKIAQPVESDDTVFPDWVPESALKFLMTIQNAGSSGADSDAMRCALGVTEPKALGGRSAMINRFIEHVGFSQAQVYDNKRTSAGRFWKPRKHLGDAIDRISDALAAAQEERGS